MVTLVEADIVGLVLDMIGDAEVSFIFENDGRADSCGGNEAE